MLRIDGPTLLSTKLLVIARLLLKALHGRDDTPDFVQRFGNRLSLLRDRLLRHIDRRLIRHRGNIFSLVEDLTAFSLATTSGPVDVLHHFLEVRSRVIKSPRRPTKKAVKESVLDRLELFVNTARESKNIFPDLLNASLKGVSSIPILRDESVLEIDDLRLDIHERWFSEDIKNYTPWTRHDELQKAEADNALVQWVQNTLDALVRSIASDVADENDIHAIAETRKNTLQKWLSSRRFLQGLDGQHALQRMKEPFVARMRAVVKQESSNFSQDFCDTVMNGLALDFSQASRLATASLWEPSTLSRDIEDGAETFKRTVIDRRLGRGLQLHQALDSFQEFSKDIERFQESVKEMRDVKWEDDFDEDEDEDEDQSTLHVLSRNDPEDLHRYLREDVQETIGVVQSRLVEDVQKRSPDCQNPNSPGIFVFRTIRELRHLFPRVLVSLEARANDSGQSQEPFCQPAVDSLQSALIADVIQSTKPTFSASLRKRLLSSTKVQFSALWDNGIPPLPVQPWPTTFAYLRDTVKKMEHLGPDLWNLELVSDLKEGMACQIAEVAEPAIRQLTDGAKDKMAAAEKEQKIASAPKSPEMAVNDDGQEQLSESEKKNDEAAGETQPEKGNNGSPQPERDQEPGPSAENHEPTDEEEKSNQYSELERQKQIYVACDKLTQLLFDVSFVQCACSQHSDSAPGQQKGKESLELVVKQILSGHAALLSDNSGREDQPESEKRRELDAAALERLRKSASEYWRRTYALFGLLAG